MSFDGSNSPEAVPGEVTKTVILSKSGLAS